MFCKPYHQPLKCASAPTHCPVCDHGSAQLYFYHCLSTSVPDYRQHLRHKQYNLLWVQRWHSSLIFLDRLTAQGVASMIVIKIVPPGEWNFSHSLWTRQWLPLPETKGTSHDSWQSYVSCLASNQHKQSLHAHQTPQKMIHGASQLLLTFVCSLAFQYSIWSKLGPHYSSSWCLDLCWQRMTL